MAMTRPPDPYQILGLNRNATVREVKQAYRSEVFRCHPDRDPSPWATERFRLVHAAYRLLIDDDLRRWYDRNQEAAVHGARWAPQRTTAPRPAFRRERPATLRQRSLFKGLHLTGFCFGWALLIGIPTGVLLADWPGIVLVLTFPGLVVIPESLDGLLQKEKAGA
jgi:hypothetical protein